MIARKDQELGGPSQTPMERVWFRAADVRMQLDRLLTQPALSATGFQEAALIFAGVDAKRIAKVTDLVNGALEYNAIQSTRRGLVRLHRDRRITHQPTGVNFRRLMTTTAAGDIEVECAALKISMAELFAAVIFRLADTHPDQFGEIEHWESLESRSAELQGELVECYASMKRTLAAPDLLSHDPSNVVLRKARSVKPFGNDDWPEHAVNFLLRVAGVDHSTRSSGPSFAAKRRMTILADHEERADKIDAARRSAAARGVEAHFLNAQRQGRIDEWLAALASLHDSYAVADRLFGLTQPQPNYLEFERGKLVRAQAF